MRHLALKDKMGRLIRTFLCETDTACLVYRKNKGRLDICSSPHFFEEDSVILIDKWDLSKMSGAQPLPFLDGFVELCENVLAEPVAPSCQRADLHHRLWSSFAIVTAGFAIFAGTLLSLNRLIPSESDKKPIIPQTVQIVKAPAVFSPMEKVFIDKASMSQKNPVQKQKKPVQKSLKRMGALSALGSLSKKDSSQKGGLNLNSNNKVSAGPGLRSLAGAGSGGVQDSLYNQGLLANALGSGGNIRGGGGHGTKGTRPGGGQAGYGALTFIGSGGASELSSVLGAVAPAGFDYSIIEREIVKKSKEIKNCYDRALKTEPGLKGLFKIHFAIGSKGRVVFSKTHPSSPVRSKKISSCILKIVNQIQFPVKLNQTVNVVYPFNLSTLTAKMGGLQ